MQKPSIDSYLDAGSLCLFSEQISEALGHVVVVAVHDHDGRLVWSGPAERGKVNWVVNPLRVDELGEAAYSETLPGGGRLVSFPLRQREEDRYLGSMSVELSPDRDADLRTVQQRIAPILDCVERQISINVELSAVRRMSEQDQRDMSLLMALDQADRSSPADAALDTLLERCASHFEAELVAVSLPDTGVNRFFPTTFAAGEGIPNAITSMFATLMNAAKRNRQVFLSEIASKSDGAAGRRSVCCCPVFSANDAVIGILVAIRRRKFARREVRLVRGIANRVNALVGERLGNSSALKSRHEFLAQVASVLRRHPNGSHALLYVDVDKLHVVNDNFGHMAGDEVIRAAAVCMTEAAGSSDVIGHLAGDHFALFMRDADARKASEKAEVLLNTIAGMFVSYGGQEIRVTASAGIALIPDIVQDAAAAVNTAEVASRSAKGRGGNRVVVFRDADASVAQRRSDLDQVSRLQSALIEDRFMLVAQPIEALNDRESSARFEILLRMHQPGGKALMPGRFLSAAERYQMMAALDRWVIRRTLDMLGDADNVLEVSLGTFSINLSSQSLNDDSFIDFVESRIIESGVPADCICFEITETAVVRDLERAQRCIRRLRSLGCRLALDDFGTGYCSFAYLKDLPVQYIKIDGVFVRDMLENPLSEAIIQSVTSIANVINAATVAEHVENELVMQRLRLLHVDYVQGFVVGKPRPFAEVLNELGNDVVGALQSPGLSSA